MHDAGTGGIHLLLPMSIQMILYRIYQRTDVNKITNLADADTPLHFQDKIGNKSIEIIVFLISGDGNVRILRQSCTSGYKYETFRICSLILSNKYFLVSHLKFFHFQGG